MTLGERGDDSAARLAAPSAVGVAAVVGRHLSTRPGAFPVSAPHATSLQEKQHTSQVASLKKEMQPELVIPSEPSVFLGCFLASLFGGIFIVNMCLWIIDSLID